MMINNDKGKGKGEKRAHPFEDIPGEMRVNTDHHSIKVRLDHHMCHKTQYGYEHH